MITFDSIKGGTLAWLGSTPGEKRIQCDFGSVWKGEAEFHVLNGAWNGTLYDGPSGLHIIDERGGRHEPIFITEICERISFVSDDVDQIPF